MSALDTPFRPSDIPTGLEGYWKLDEASGTRADSGPSGNRNPLTDNATVASVAYDYWRTGENSADFTSANSEFLSIADASQTGLDMTGGLITFAAFIRRKTSGVSQYIVAKGEGSGSSPGYSLRITAGDKLELTAGSSAGSTFESVTSIERGRWYHIAFVLDFTNDYQAFYIDGNVDAVAAKTNNPPTDTGSAFYLGQTFGGGTYFNGLMKDAAIWSAVLTPQQIRSLALGFSFSQLTYRPNNVSVQPTEWWKLNEISTGGGAVTRVGSVGAVNLTDNATVTTNGSFVEGAGARFTAANSEYLSLASNAIFNIGTADFSICKWLRKATSSEQVVFSMGSTTNFYFDWHSVGGGRIDIGFGGVNQSTSFPENVGAWCHYAFTRTSGTVRVYVDGKLVNSPLSMAGSITQGNINFGAFSTPAAYYNGDMADLAYWNGYALSATEVASLAAGVPIQQSGLVSYWKLDETSGTRVDSVGGNDLTDVNTVTSETNTRTGRTMASFDPANSEYLSLADGSQVPAGSLEDSINFSTTFWQTPDIASGQRYILSKGAGSTSTEYNWRNDGANNLIWEIGQSGGLNNPSISGNPVANRDYFCAGVWFGNGARMYKDDIVVGYIAANEGINVKDGTFAGNTKAFNIGAENQGSGSFYDGGIGDVTWWSRNLRDDEIKMIMLKGLNNRDITSSEVTLATSNFFLAM